MEYELHKIQQGQMPNPASEMDWPLVLIQDEVCLVGEATLLRRPIKAKLWAEHESGCLMSLRKVKGMLESIKRRKPSGVYSPFLHFVWPHIQNCIQVWAHTTPKTWITFSKFNGVPPRQAWLEHLPSEKGLRELGLFSQGRDGSGELASAYGETAEKRGHAPHSHVWWVDEGE